MSRHWDVNDEVGFSNLLLHISTQPPSAAFFTLNAQKAEYQIYDDEMNRKSDQTRVYDECFGHSSIVVLIV